MKESVIQNIKDELIVATNPIIKPLHKNSNFRTLVMGFKKGMELKSHKTNWPSKLTVLEGSVTYRLKTEDILLQKYDEQEIEVNVNHSVSANSDSLCLLTQSKPSS